MGPLVPRILHLLSPNRGLGYSNQDHVVVASRVLSSLVVFGSTITEFMHLVIPTLTDLFDYMPTTYVNESKHIFVVFCQPRSALLHFRFPSGASPRAHSCESYQGGRSIV